MQKTQEVWLVCNASLLSLLRQTKGFFCFSFNKRSQKHAAAKTWVFCIRFFSKTKRKTAEKNAAQCISSHLKATSKISGTFENTPKKVDFPLSIVFDQALHLSFVGIVLKNIQLRRRDVCLFKWSPIFFSR